MKIFLIRIFHFNFNPPSLSLRFYGISILYDAKKAAIATAVKDFLSLFIVTENVLNFQLKSYFSFLTTALNFLTDFQIKSPHHDHPHSFYGSTFF